MSWLIDILWCCIFGGKEALVLKPVVFLCLSCGHDMSKTDVTTCPSCGDSAALDPDLHEEPIREFLNEAPAALLGVAGGYRSSERAEHLRRLKLQRDSEIEKLVGRTATTTSPLRPAGDVEIDGKQYYACSQDGLVDSHTEVLIVGVKGRSLVVCERD